MCNQNPVIAAVWVSESGVDRDEAQKCGQYKQRQRRLPACILHAKFSDVRGNVAAHSLQPSEIDESSENARCIFVDCRNTVKSMCRWLLLDDDSSIKNTMATGI